MQLDRKTKSKIKYIIIIVLALAALIVYGVVRQANRDEVVLSESDLSSTETTETATGKVIVHVAGAVVNPGVYTLTGDVRVIDAIEAAGGMTDEADGDALNLAAPIEDGQKITVYTTEQTAGSGTGTGSNTGLININTASQDELETLPGIGEVIAGNIIDYREDNGSFSSIEEIKNVNRIGDKLYEQIKDLITI